MHHRYAQLLSDPGRDHVVLIVRRVFLPPGIVTPVYADLAGLSTRAYQEGGSVMATLRIIAGVQVERDIDHVLAVLLQPPGRRQLQPGIGYIDAHHFPYRHKLYELCVNRENAIDLPRP